MAHNSFRVAVASRVNHEVVYFKNRYNTPSPGFAFWPWKCTTSLREFLCKIFSQREFTSCREYYQDFASREDSRWDPGGEFFSWWDPNKDRILGGIIAKVHGGNFSRGGSRWENWPPWRDPGGILGGSCQDPGTYFTRAVPRKVFLVWTLLPLCKFQFRFIISYKNLAFETPFTLDFPMTFLRWLWIFAGTDKLSRKTAEVGQSV